MLDILGNRVTELRKSKKLSQAELAELIGKSKDVVGRYERGTISASIEVVVKIADALEVSIDYLVGNTDMQLKQEVLDRIKRVEELPEDEKKVIYRVVDSLTAEYHTRNQYK